jgi:hypothetical protein
MTVSRIHYRPSNEILQVIDFRTVFCVAIPLFLGKKERALNINIKSGKVQSFSQVLYPLFKSYWKHIKICTYPPYYTTFQAKHALFKITIFIFILLFKELKKKILLRRKKLQKYGNYFRHFFINCFKRKSI